MVSFRDGARANTRSRCSNLISRRYGYEGKISSMSLTSSISVPTSFDYRKVLYNQRKQKKSKLELQQQVT
jgi:hypothetical protein